MRIQGHHRWYGGGCHFSAAKSCQFFATPWTGAWQATLSSTIYRSLLKFMSIDSVMLSNHLIFYCPLLLLPSIFSRIQMNQLFTSGGQTIGATVWASALPMNIQGWFPLGLTGLSIVQGALKSLLQHHNLKASILQHSVFFIDQISHWYMTTGKPVALTICIFVIKVTSLLFNTLSRFVIASKE